MATHVRLTATVRGRVQGVGFRYFTLRQARALGVTGWVRNEPDRSVSLEAEGPRASLEALLDALRQGPSAARVTDVDVHWRPATDVFIDFRVQY